MRKLRLFKKNALQKLYKNKEKPFKTKKAPAKKTGAQNSRKITYP